MKFSLVAIPLVWLSVAVSIPVLSSASPAGSPRNLLSPSSGTVQLLPTSNSAPFTDVVGPVLSAIKGTVHLPLVTRAYRSRPRCSPESPFSLQIAALHQVSQTQGVDALAQERWLEAYNAAFPSLVEQLRDSGACWARLRIDWAWLQAEPKPDYFWAAYHDEKLRLVAEAGVQVIAHIDGVPAWAGDAPYGPIDAGHLDEFAQFLTALVNHYKQPPYNVHHWELFNEPDMTEPPGSQHGWGLHGERYAAMLAVAYPAIKAADPAAIVLMGGVAQDWFLEYDGPFFRYFTDQVVAAGGAEHVDRFNFHYFPDFHAEWERWDPDSEYCRDTDAGVRCPPTCGDLFDGQGQEYDAGGVDLIAKASHFRNRLRVCYGVEKPIWITEMGEHGFAGDPNSLVRQARYVIQGYARGLAAGVENITWFALVSPPYDPHEQGLLFQVDFSPKPAFYAFQTLTYELEGYHYDHTLVLPGVEGYAFRDKYQQEKLVAWWAADWPPSGSLPVVSASRIRVVDREGTVSHIEDGAAGDLDGMLNGAVVLGLTAEPVFVSR